MDIISNQYFICISGLLIGIIVNIVSKLAKLEEDEKFSLRVWMSQNFWRTLSSISSTLIGVLYMMESGSQIGFFEALSIGFVGDAIIKRGSKSAKPLNKGQNAGWTGLKAD